MSTEEETLFEGHQPRDCGEHRTVGSHRAWCFDCGEWCYPTAGMGCVRCEMPRLQALADALFNVLDKNFNDKGMFIWEEDTPIAEIVEVMARYREARTVEYPERTNEHGNVIDYGPQFDEEEDHEHNFDRVLFGGGLACTICDAVQPEPGLMTRLADMAEDNEPTPQPEDRNSAARGWIPKAEDYQPTINKPEVW